MVQEQKHPGTMALGVDLAVIQLADQYWCFEIHHTFSVNVLTLVYLVFGCAAGYVGKKLSLKITLC